MLAITYLVIVWSMSALIRILERHLALPEDAAMSTPDWVGPVARYMLEVGLQKHAQALGDRARRKHADRGHARARCSRSASCRRARSSASTSRSGAGFRSS